MLPWARMTDQNPADRGLYLLVINSKIVAGVFVWHAEKKKFYWGGIGVKPTEVELCLPFNALASTLPVSAQARAIARAAHLTEFLERAAA